MTAAPRLLCLVLLALALTGPVAAEEVRTPDKERLDSFDAHFGAAMRVALARGTAADRTVLIDAMTGAGGPLSGAEGDWKCRTLKLGGITDLTVYPDFRCRITDDLTLIKLTGSQRLKGRIHPDGTFLGVGHVGTAPATDYAGLPPTDQTPVEPNQTTADVGLFELISPSHARLMLPAPLLESRFDILYLTR